MMKQLLLLTVCLVFLPLTICGQEEQNEEEYDYIEKTMKIWPEDDNKYNVTTGAPIVTTSPFSQSETLYCIGDLMALDDDKIVKIGYMGYNPGGEVERHVTIWMQRVNISEMRLSSWYAPTEDMIKVFDGDIVIKSGGDADHWIQLIDITLDVPFTYYYDNVRVTIVSSGEPSDHDVYFASSNSRWNALYSTADQMENVSESPQYDNSPQLKYTIASKVEYLTGKVCDQDGNPLSGAEVTLSTCLWEQNEYKGVTDADGNYQVRVSEGHNVFLPFVEAPGCVSYWEKCREYVFENTSMSINATILKDKKMDFTLYNVLEFKKGKIGSIILPVAPDPTLGRYYRLDHREDYVIVFKLEPNPQANVPYLLIANEDCRVDLSGMDLTIAPGETELEDVSFIGTYVSSNFWIPGNCSVYVFDETPDCAELIGGCRAYLFMDFWDDISVVLDETDGVEQIVATPNDNKTEYFDLQGRRLNDKPSKGIYILNGKKVVIK